jgi:adenine phosphoribosyltransferase
MIPNSPSKKIDVVVGLDARGFILGPIIALRLGAAFVPVRKRGKLPGKCVSATYEKEYGEVRSSLVPPPSNFFPESLSIFFLVVYFACYVGYL